MGCRLSRAKSRPSAGTPQGRRTLELDQRYAWAHHVLGLAWEAEHEYDEAFAEFEKSQRGPSGNLGQAYAVASRRAEALKILDQLKSRYKGKQTLIKQLRPYLSNAAAAVGIATAVVPHQLRHTYATEMVRAGVSLPALMTLLGHVKAEMTMKYVQVVGNDLQREFLLARSRPRHLVPQPKAPAMSPRAGLDGVADALLFAQHAIEMFRRSMPDGNPRRCLDRLSNRLTKILSEARQLNPSG
jgi:tetratricopeptide (TPR) repeat protein